MANRIEPLDKTEIQTMLNNLETCLLEKISENRKTMLAAVEDVEWITLQKNGNERILRRKVIADNYHNIAEIKKVIEPFSDLATLFKIAKKYKFWWWGFPPMAITGLTAIVKLLTG